jgi:hypothetical protein
MSMASAAHVGHHGHLGCHPARLRDGQAHTRGYKHRKKHNDDPRQRARFHAVDIAGKYGLCKPESVRAGDQPV